MLEALNSEIASNVLSFSRECRAFLHVVGPNQPAALASTDAAS